MNTCRPSPTDAFTVISGHTWPHYLSHIWSQVVTGLIVPDHRRIHCHISTFFSFFLLKWKNDFFFFFALNSDVTEPESDAEHDSSISSTIDGFEPPKDVAPSAPLLLLLLSLLLPPPVGPTAPVWLMLEPLREDDSEGELETRLASKAAAALCCRVVIQ